MPTAVTLEDIITTVGVMHTEALTVKHLLHNYSKFSCSCASFSHCVQHAEGREMLLKNLKRSGKMMVVISSLF